MLQSLPVSVRFREITDDELAKYEALMRKLINNAAFLSDDMNAIALGMINGSIEGSFPRQRLYGFGCAS